MTKKVSYKGKIYESIKEFIAETGLKPYSAEVCRDITIYSQLYCVNGIKFDTIKQACEHFGAKYTTVLQRLYNGMELGEAITKPDNQKRGIYSKDHLGNTFVTLKDMCAYWHIKPNTFTGRLNRGYSIKEALTTAKGRRKHG